MGKKAVSRVQHIGMFLSRTPLRILRTDRPAIAWHVTLPALGLMSPADTSHASDSWLAVGRRNSSIAIVSSQILISIVQLTHHLSVYLSPLSPGAATLAVLSHQALSRFLGWSAFPLPAAHFSPNDTQDHQPSHPHRRSLRLGRPQLIIPLTPRSRQPSSAR